MWHLLTRLRARIPQRLPHRIPRLPPGNLRRRPRAHTLAPIPTWARYSCFRGLPMVACGPERNSHTRLRFAWLAVGFVPFSKSPSFARWDKALEARWSILFFPRPRCLSAAPNWCFVSMQPLIKFVGLAWRPPPPTPNVEIGNNRQRPRGCICGLPVP